MSGDTRQSQVGALPDAAREQPRTPAVLTRAVWVLWVASLAALLGHALTGRVWTAPGLVVDGTAVLLWTVVTFFSGVVHSFSRRYMAGERGLARFYRRVFGFTLAVMVLVAADHLALFAAAWLAMGLVMAGLVGHVRSWREARAAGRLARRYFLASSALVGAAFVVLWWTTGATTVTGVAAATPGLSGAAALGVGGLLLLAAMVQSALVPFHTWLLASMTAPTPASALMHAGFVNAGGLLLARFSPVVTAEPAVMLAAVVVGAVSALAGKLFRTVHASVKGQLGCSTVGQMGFMILQAGLGFFAAAVAHLILHGFYKAYLFLSAGEAVGRTVPGDSDHGGRTTLPGVVVTVLAGVVAGVVFAALTGKGAAADSGLLLTGLVVLTTLHAAQTAVSRRGVAGRLRYGVVALVVVPAVALYGLVYTAVAGLMKGTVPVAAPTELSVVHVVVAVAFLGAYVAVETGAYARSTRLWVTVRRLSRPPGETLLTDREGYDE